MLDSRGYYAWKCQVCGRVMTGKRTGDSGNWTCVRCAAKSSAQSPSREPEPAGTSTSNSSTGTPASQNSSSPAPPAPGWVPPLQLPVPTNPPKVNMTPDPPTVSPLDVEWTRVPTAALIMLLEVAGGSLVMELHEAIRAPRDRGLTSDWVTNNETGTRLVLELFDVKQPQNWCGMSFMHDPHPVTITDKNGILQYETCEGVQ